MSDTKQMDKIRRLVQAQIEESWRAVGWTDEDFENDRRLMALFDRLLVEGRTVEDILDDWESKTVDEILGDESVKVRPFTTSEALVAPHSSQR
jgi:hypothetical protein